MLLTWAVLFFRTVQVRRLKSESSNIRKETDCQSFCLECQMLCEVSGDDLTRRLRTLSCKLKTYRIPLRAHSPIECSPCSALFDSVPAKPLVHFP